MKIQEFLEVHDILEKYDRLKKEIEKASCLNLVTLSYNYGHRSHDMRGDDITDLKVALVRSLEQQANTLLSGLVNKGVDIDHERGFLDTLVKRALKEPITNETVRRGEPV